MTNLLPVNATAAAVPVKNEKGVLTMEKVRVARYVAGKIPEYAGQERDEDDDEEIFDRSGAAVRNEEEASEASEEEIDMDVDDRRLRRLMLNKPEEITESRRRIREPEILELAEDDVGVVNEEEEEDEAGSEEISDDEIERKRQLLLEKARQREEERDAMDVEDEIKSEEEEEEESEYETESDSEEEAPRLKPVFIRKADRVTVKEREKIEEAKVRLEENNKRTAQLRRKESVKLAGEAIRRELQDEQGEFETSNIGDVNTDDENEEEAYEMWKVRELKRIKRDREERERMEKEKQEIDSIHQMTEEERHSIFKSNPKEITNKATKGKYKFLQKYYHRGVFYLEEEQNVLKRDVSMPTLEDHFDKTILPQVMQVKDFGRAGRTKWTHLVNEDTTKSDSPWAQANPLNVKISNKGGGMKQDFARPSGKKRKV